MIIKKKKPHFHRQQSHIYKRVSRSGWRRPMGKDSKQKRKEKSRGKRPNVGYGQPREIRYLHPSGFLEKRVFNVNDLAGLDSKKHAIRISSSVGKMKRLEIIKKAQEMKLKVLNE